MKKLLILFILLFPSICYAQYGGTWVDHMSREEMEAQIMRIDTLEHRLDSKEIYFNDIVVGATETTEGKAGFVPKPTYGDDVRVLFGDGKFKRADVKEFTYHTLVTGDTNLKSIKNNVWAEVNQFIYLGTSRLGTPTKIEMLVKNATDSNGTLEVRLVNLDNGTIFVDATSVYVNNGQTALAISTIFTNTPTHEAKMSVQIRHQVPGIKQVACLNGVITFN